MSSRHKFAKLTTMSINIVHPPEMVETKDPVIFLAGPIQDGPDWQAEAIEIFRATNTDVTIASPRKGHAEWDFVYEKQVDWETEYLRRAAKLGVMMFWLALQNNLSDADERGFYRAYAQTSRFELGEAKMKHQLNGAKLVVGIEPGFGNDRYIRRRLSQDCPDVPILNTLGETCRVAVEQAQST